jgi:hypothetical protein
LEIRQISGSKFCQPPQTRADTAQIGSNREKYFSDGRIFLAFLFPVWYNNFYMPYLTVFFGELYRGQAVGR